MYFSRQYFTPNIEKKFSGKTTDPNPIGPKLFKWPNWPTPIQILTHFQACVS